MLLGTQDIRKGVKGTFKKYYIRSTVKRTTQTEHLRCFSDNDLKEHVNITVAYARNDDAMQFIASEWTKTYGENIWKYEVINCSSIRNNWMSVDDVLDDFISRNGFSLTPSYTEIGHREIIH